MPNEFGKNLRAARIRTGLTQAEVAKRTGLTQQYVSVVEAGRQNLTLSTMTTLADAIGHEGRAKERNSRGAMSGGGGRTVGNENPGGGTPGFSDWTIEFGGTRSPRGSNSIDQ